MAVLKSLALGNGSPLLAARGAEIPEDEFKSYQHDVTLFVPKMKINLDRRRTLDLSQMKRLVALTKYIGFMKCTPRY